MQLSRCFQFLLINPSAGPISLATTFGVSVDFLSYRYLDVSVPCVRSFYTMYSCESDLAAGFPHSDIRGSMLIHSSPRLFAVYHVLLRLWLPRHSPNALTYRLILYVSIISHPWNLIYTLSKIYPFLIFHIKRCIFYFLLRFYSNSFLFFLFTMSL